MKLIDEEVLLLFNIHCQGLLDGAPCSTDGYTPCLIEKSVSYCYQQCRVANFEERLAHFTEKRDDSD
jgi:hypothetical protein